MNQGLLKSSLCQVRFKVRLWLHAKVKGAQPVRQEECRAQLPRRALKAVQIGELTVLAFEGRPTGEYHCLPG